jgi:hypothetical protein
MGASWHARLPGAAGLVRQAAAGRRTETLLKDMAMIDASRQDIDRNINIGLALAVLFEGLIEHAEQDQPR